MMCLVKLVVLVVTLQGACASFESIKTFSPFTSVSDQLAISHDQAVLESLLAARTEQSFDQAQRVYSEGGNSKTIATLTLAGGLPVNVSEGTKLTAKGLDARDVVGTCENSAVVGSTTIQFRYPTTDNMQNHLDCRVGGLPAPEQIFAGCLVSAGVLLIDGVALPVDYQYDITTDNNSGRTLASFSTLADGEMRPGHDFSNPFFRDFQLFFDYYGTFDYADQIITAALEGVDTNLVNGNVNVMTATVGLVAREEIARKGTVYLSVAMYILSRLEDSIYDCDSQCEIGYCNDDANVHSLDEAVAYYFGADDNLLHALANKRCANFGTCRNDVEGDALVNDKIFDRFGQMQASLVQGRCNSARPYVEEIAAQMWIPMIQGTLRYAWILDVNANPGALPSEKAQAEGSIFAAAVLPVIHACDSEAAATIFENMQLKASINVDFLAVKAAFEECYRVIGITCSEVGGIVNNAGTDYAHDFTRPCDDDDDGGGDDDDDDEPPQASTRLSLEEVIAQTFSLRSLEAYLGVGQLIDDMLGPGPFTMFTPADWAFDALGDDLIAKLQDQRWSAHLRNLLFYHIYYGDLPIDELEEIQELTMANDERIVITRAPGTSRVHVNDILVLAPYDATNGFAYMVDKVLLPSWLDRSLLQMLQADYPTLTSLIVRARLEFALSNPEQDLTVFVPSESAFSHLHEGTLGFLMSDEGLGILEDTLLYHIIWGGPVPSINVLPILPATFATLLDGVTIEIIPGQPPSVQGIYTKASITQFDQLAANGIFHVVDTVLLLGPGGNTWAPDDTPTRAPTQTQTPTHVPTRAPAAIPTTEPAGSTGEAFTSFDDLLNAVDDYLLAPDGSLTAARWGHPINAWDVSQMTRFRLYDFETDDGERKGLFDAQRNQALETFNEDITGWDVSACTDFSYMFRDATAFNQPIGEWDMGSATTLNYMFNNATSFNANLDAWDVSNVESMDLTFYQATGFTSDLSGWNTAMVATLFGTFAEASSFNGDLSRWDVGLVDDTKFMFFKATSFESDLSAWNVGNVFYMESMFDTASRFTSDLSAWNVGNVRTMDFMFNQAELFQSDLSQWNTARVIDMRTMFQFCAFFNSDLSGWQMDHVTDISFMFNGAESFASDLSSWNVENVEGMAAVFQGALRFNSDLSAWDTSKVWTMESMFLGATLFNGDISSWNVTNVNTTSLMFYDTAAFNIQLASWNVGNVKDMSSMFNRADAFNQDLSTWNISGVTDMDYMFFRARAFNQNLCPWGRQLAGAGNTDISFRQTFQFTECETDLDPDLTATPPGPFCFTC